MLNPALLGCAPLDIATSKYIAAMTVRPNFARQQVIDKLVRALKRTAATEGGSLWSQLGVLYLLASHDKQASYLNLMNPGTATLTEIGSPGPTFTRDGGVAGDGAQAALSTGLTRAQIPGFVQNSAHAGIWSAGGAGGVLVGLNGNTGLYASTFANRASIVNSNTQLSTSVDGSNGYVVATRRESTTDWSYRNGAHELSIAAASLALNGFIVTFLLENTTFAAAGINLCIGHLGSMLSAADVALLYPIFRSYLISLGVSVT